MRRNEAAKLFGLNNLIIEAEIQRIEDEYDVDLGHRRRPKTGLDQKYYPQFTERLRDQAKSMATNYVIFYCLENSIRELLVQRLEEEEGVDWWDNAVPEKVRENAKRNMKKEMGAGVTPRSSELIDYINFGELAEIIQSNWEVFGDMFQDVGAVRKILGSLNTLRAPIAHCTTLAEDEVLRLHLSLADWFRQME